MIKKVVLVFAALALIIAFCGDAAAKSISEPNAKVVISYPSGWKEKIAGDVFQIDAPTGDATITFRTLEASDLPKAVAQTQKIISEQFGQIKSVSQSEMPLNGMYSYVEDATDASGELKISIFIVITPSGKALLGTYAATLEADRFYEEELLWIIQSIRPLEPAGGEGK